MECSKLGREIIFDLANPIKTIPDINSVSIIIFRALFGFRRRNRKRYDSNAKFIVAISFASKENVVFAIDSRTRAKWRSEIVNRHFPAGERNMSENFVSNL